MAEDVNEVCNQMVPSVHLAVDVFQMTICNWVVRLYFYLLDKTKMLVVEPTRLVLILKNQPV